MEKASISIFPYPTHEVNVFSIKAPERGQPLQDLKNTVFFILKYGV